MKQRNKPELVAMALRTLKGFVVLNLSEDSKRVCQRSICPSISKSTIMPIISIMDDFSSNFTNRLGGILLDLTYFLLSALSTNL